MSITFYESNNDRQERAARNPIKGIAQAKRNAAEWLTRSIDAAQSGDNFLAARLRLQARLELRPYSL